MTLVQCHCRELDEAKETISIGGFQAGPEIDRPRDFEDHPPTLVCADGDDRTVMAVIQRRDVRAWVLKYQTAKHFLQVHYPAATLDAAQRKAVRHMHYHLNRGANGKLIAEPEVPCDRPQKKD